MTSQEKESKTKSPQKKNNTAKKKSAPKQNQKPAPSPKAKAPANKKVKKDADKSKTTKEKPQTKAVVKGSQGKKSNSTPKKNQPKKIAEKDIIQSPMEETALQNKEISEDALERGDLPMSMVGHLDELRSRIIVIIIAVITITLGSFFLSDHMLDIINKPFISTGYKLNIFNLTEGFLLRVKASLIAAIFISFPLIIYELWKYIQPAVDRKDRKFIVISIIAALVLFYSGLLFTYIFILPFAIKMLISFTPQEMANTIGASKYLNFVLLFSLGMGLMFELPIIVMILSRIGIITPHFLIQKRKYAIVLIFIVAAMLTPPDVLTQMMLAIPVILLYEISIIISKFIVKRKKKKELTLL